MKMKRVVSCLLLLGLVAFTGCPGDANAPLILRIVNATALPIEAVKAQVASSPASIEHDLIATGIRAVGAAGAPIPGGTEDTFSFFDPRNNRVWTIRCDFRVGAGAGQLQSARQNILLRKGVSGTITWTL